MGGKKKLLQERDTQDNHLFGFFVKWHINLHWLFNANTILVIEP